MSNERIGLIGAGQMATALAVGFVKAGLVSAEGLVASDPLPGARERFRAAVGAEVLTDNAAVVAGANTVVLAVKPQQLFDVLRPLAGRWEGKLVVSVVAGVRTERLAAVLAGGRLVRVMPNTPCLVGAGASAYCAGPGATPADLAFVGRLLGAVGRAIEVDEKLMDAVTGLSGSGPAFAYLMIEALSDGGVRMGLPRATATTLAAQTLFGAAAMVLQSGDHPGVLKDRVASPGGTTIAGLQALEDRGLRGALIAAVEAAAARSAQLSS